MVASFRCTPVAHACINTGDALSILCVNERSWKFALPAPAPLPATATEFVTPQDQLRTSISSLCLLSWDSPLMSPSFAKMSAATRGLLHSCAPASRAATGVREGARRLCGRRGRDLRRCQRLVPEARQPIEPLRHVPGPVAEQLHAPRQD